MRIVRLLATVFFVAIIGASNTWAQTQTSPCQKETDEIMPPGTNCTSAQNIATGTFHARPFMDTVLVNGHWPDYGDQDHNVVSLYGAYGNNENNPSFTAAQAHYQQGITLANKITPLCQDGSLPSGNTCPAGQPAPAIVFLFIGMSNFDIELGGGNKDAWANDPQMLSGQPCSSVCPNLNNPSNPNPWNQVPGDPIVQQSLLYQIYSPTTHLVGAHVVVWNGALEGQALAQWDPSPAGYYNANDCPYHNEMASGPECNYERVQYDLAHATANGNTNGYSEKQVQAVFIKVADLFPQCDLNRGHCSAPR